MYSTTNAAECQHLLCIWSSDFFVMQFAYRRKFSLFCRIFAFFYKTIELLL